MKYLFLTGILSLLAFEIAQVYFIMPLPGSQEMNSISLAYSLYHYRWVIRGVAGLLIVLGIRDAFSKHRIPVGVALIATGAVAYYTNLEMAADSIFLQPRRVQVEPVATSTVDTSRIIIGIADEAQARAYPIQYLGYHHQVFDTLSDKPVMVTYCTVCRTGRVFLPLVKGQTTHFRLVGMDHFNAMFEDETTHSWWRQATGESVAGSLKGALLPPYPSLQMSLGNWLRLYPNSLIMQPDTFFQAEYDSMRTYEGGRLKGKLTRRDTLSWKEKSWVVGIESGKEQKAYDWNALLAEGIIYDVLDKQPVALVLTNDKKGFVGLVRAYPSQQFTLKGDTLIDQRVKYNLLGKSFTPTVPDLRTIPAFQEYWHSWRTFHPKTTRYPR